MPWRFRGEQGRTERPVHHRHRGNEREPIAEKDQRRGLARLVPESVEKYVARDAVRRQRCRTPSNQRDCEPRPTSPSTTVRVRMKYGGPGRPPRSCVSGRTSAFRLLNQDHHRGSAGAVAVGCAGAGRGMASGRMMREHEQGGDHQNVVRALERRARRGGEGADTKKIDQVEIGGSGRKRVERGSIAAPDVETKIRNENCEIPESKDLFPGEE